MSNDPDYEATQRARRAKRDAARMAIPNEVPPISDDARTDMLHWALPRGQGSTACQQARWLLAIDARLTFAIREKERAEERQREAEVARDSMARDLDRLLDTPIWVANALRDSALAHAESLREVVALCDGPGSRAGHVLAPEDPEVLALCERVGFGAVMDSAARQWFKRDPNGALTVGPCAATVRAALAARPTT